MIFLHACSLEKKIDPKHTALVVVDIQNDFCSPTGVLGRMGKNVAEMDKIVEGIESLSKACREVSLPVLYTRQIYDRSKLNDLQKEQYDLDNRMITCDIAGDGWKFYKIKPPKEDTYDKYNYNIFSNHSLLRRLENEKIKTLIICGVSTQICVETAIRNGFDLGYKIVVPKELVGTTSSDPETQKRTLILTRKTYGVVTTSSEIIDILNMN